MELYGQNMLRDIVGSSLLAKAPYAADRATNMQHHIKGVQSKGESVAPVPNARAGSMKQQLVQQRQQQQHEEAGAY